MLIFFFYIFYFLELLAKHYTQSNAHVHKQFVRQLNAYCNRTVLDEGPDEIVHHYQWTYYNAFFFALTTLSTIGKCGTATITNVVHSSPRLISLCNSVRPNDRVGRTENIIEHRIVSNIGNRNRYAVQKKHLLYLSPLQCHCEHSSRLYSRPITKTIFSIESARTSSSIKFLSYAKKKKNKK